MNVELIPVSAPITAPTTPPGAITTDIFNRFVAFIDASESTAATYTRTIRQFIKYLQQNCILNPTRSDILAYKKGLETAGKKPTTINNYLTAVKMFFKWTASEGIYPNIADHVKAPKLDRAHKKDYLTENQVSEILAGIDRGTPTGKRNYAIFFLMVTCGFRDIEVSRANIEDLRAVGKNTALYVQGKGRTERTDAGVVDPVVEKAIREYLKTRSTLDPKQPLFASTSNNNRGQRLTPRSISEIIKKILKAAGFDTPRLTAHSLRHTAITLSFLSGKDVTEVQQFARHANINTTMIYNHALNATKNTCSAAVTAAILNANVNL